MELITIIVPVYNVEKYLKRCIESIINQTYKELEILLIDDGSKDDSYLICEEYARIDNRIKVFHKTNEGLGLTRNYGLRLATGKYVSFVDSDDFLEPDGIEVLCRKMMESDADLIIANAFYREKPMHFMHEEGLYTEKDIKDFLMIHMCGNLSNLQDGLSITAWAKLYKRELIEKNKIEFPSERKLIWEDMAFFSDYIAWCKKVYICKHEVYNYCYNEGSLTHVYKPNKLELVMIMYNYMLEKIEKLQLKEEAKERLMNTFIGHIRTCIKLEVFYVKDIGLNKSLGNIKSICKNEDVQKLLNEYPIVNYNRIQKIYDYFLKRKKVVCIFILTWLQNKRKLIE